MCNAKTKDKIKSFVIIILILGSFLTTIKMVFWGFVIDESFHITMAYRYIMGDKPFSEMLELYQTSTIMCVLFERIFLCFTGGSTEGIVVFVRVGGMLCHLLVSLGILLGLKRIITHEQAILIAIIYYNMLPRLSAVPDFLNLQMWCVTLVVILLINHKENDFIWNIIIGILLGISTLAYPTNIILVLVYFVWLVINGKKKIGLTSYIFSCSVFAGLYLIYLQMKTGLPTVFMNLGNVIKGDGAHATNKMINGDGVMLSLLKSIALFTPSVMMALVLGGLSYLIISKKREKEFAVWGAIIVFIVSSYIQPLILWILKHESYDCVKPYFITIVFVGIMFMMGKKKELTDHKFTVILCVVNFITMVAVSNVPISQNITYLQILVMISLFLICIVFTKFQKSMFLLLTFIAVCAIFAQGYTLKDSQFGNNVLAYRTKMSEGPTKGIYCNNNYAYLYNGVLQAFNENVTDGESVLIIPSSLGIPTGSLYMQKKVVISNHTTASTPVFDGYLLEYWMYNPNHLPNIIAVDKVYGTDWYFSKESWIYQYVTENYVLINQTEFMDFYTRK